MKIFLVCNSLGAGGAERVHVNLAKGFVECGYESFLITDLGQKQSYVVDKRVRLLDLCPKSSSKYRWFKAIFVLRSYIKRFKPDVIIGNMHLSSIICRLAAINTNVPVIMTIHHALESDTYSFNKYLPKFDKYTPRFYSATIVLTEADRLYMNKVYHHSQNVFVIPNPQSFKPLEVKGKDFFCDDGKPINKSKMVFAAGRINNWRYKGWDVLINVAKEIKPILLSYGWKICIAGGGTEEGFSFLKKLCCDAGVTDCVELLGYREDIGHLYQQASIYCLSSRSEGLPMVLIEAMSQGCAPVATDFKGRTLEVVGESMKELLCEPEDITGLANNLVRLITDEELRKRVQIEAIERAKFYSISNVIQIWKEVFSKLSIQ